VRVNVPLGAVSVAVGLADGLGVLVRIEVAGLAEATGVDVSEGPPQAEMASAASNAAIHLTVRQPVRR
jgi:hypothetical protein